MKTYSVFAVVVVLLLTGCGGGGGGNGDSIASGRAEIPEGVSVDGPNFVYARGAFMPVQGTQFDLPDGNGIPYITVYTGSQKIPVVGAVVTEAGRSVTTLDLEGIAATIVYLQPFVSQRTASDAKTVINLIKTMPSFGQLTQQLHTALKQNPNVFADPPDALVQKVKAVTGELYQFTRGRGRDWGTIEGPQGQYGFEVEQVGFDTNRERFKITHYKFRWLVAEYPSSQGTAILLVPAREKILGFHWGGPSTIEFIVPLRDFPVATVKVYGWGHTYPQNLSSHQREMIDRSFGATVLAEIAFPMVYAILGLGVSPTDNAQLVGAYMLSLISDPQFWNGILNKLENGDVVGAAYDLIAGSLFDFERCKILVNIIANHFRINIDPLNVFNLLKDFGLRKILLIGLVIDLLVGEQDVHDAFATEFTIINQTTGEAALRITANLTQAPLFINGQQVGTGTAERRLPYNHTYTVSFGDVNGYVTPAAQEVFLPPQGKTVHGEYLRQEQNEGYITLDTRPVAGDIYLNGQLVGNGAFEGSRPYGHYRATCGPVEGYETDDPFEFDLSDQNRNVTHTFVYRERQRVTVDLTTEPPAAPIYVNGELKGTGRATFQVTIGTNLHIAPGHVNGWIEPAPEDVTAGPLGYSKTYHYEREQAQETTLTVKTYLANSWLKINNTFYTAGEDRGGWFERTELLPKGNTRVEWWWNKGQKRPPTWFITGPPDLQFNLQDPTSVEGSWLHVINGRISITDVHREGNIVVGTFSPRFSQGDEPTVFILDPLGREWQNREGVNWWYDGQGKAYKFGVPTRNTHNEVIFSVSGTYKIILVSYDGDEGSYMTGAGSFYFQR